MIGLDLQGILDDGDGGTDAVCFMSEQGMPDISKDLPVYDSSNGGANRLGMDEWYVINRIRYSLPVLMRLALRIDPSLAEKLKPFVLMNIMTKH